MKSSNEEWSSTICIILPNSSYTQVLAMPDSTGWVLPAFHLNERVYVANVARINDIARDQFNTNTTVLYCAFASINRVERCLQSYYVLENHTSGYVAPLEARWVHVDDLVLSEQHEIAARCLAKVVPELRPPWSHPGWFDAASSWMRERLAECGLSLKTQVEQQRSWGLSCVLSGQTERGKVYFKSASRLPLFANEPALVQALSQIYPVSIPAPIAVSDSWLLMIDVGVELRSNPDLVQWVTVLGTWAKIQKDSASHIDHLLQQGCLDRRLEHLPAQFEILLQEPAVIEDLHPEEVELLRGLIPRVSALCERLQHYHIPSTLIHGDFNSGNIAIHEGQISFFDWTDGAISHPFLDLVTFLDDASELFPDAHDRLVEAYLANWSDLESIERLREMWGFAEVLSVIYQAISYQHIKVTMEQATWAEMSGSLASYLRRAIKHLMTLDHE